MCIRDRTTGNMSGFCFESWLGGKSAGNGNDNSQQKEILHPDKKSQNRFRHLNQMIRVHGKTKPATAPATTPANNVVMAVLGASKRSMDSITINEEAIKFRPLRIIVITETRAK